MSLDLLLYVIAFILFFLAAFGVERGPVGFVPLGLDLFTMAQII